MKVIVIGGGFCGSTTAKILDKNEDIDLTLIDKKTFFEYYPGLPSSIKKEENLKDIKRKYSDFLKNARLIEDEVIEVNKNKVITKKQQRYNYDILIISTGIEYPISLKNTNKVFTLNNFNQVKKINQNLKNINKILIIGGGLIGVEAAGEIVDKTKKTKITIVHPHSRLIERNPYHASQITKNILKRKQVKIVFKEKIIKKEDNNFMTNKNRKITADLAIWAAGVKCNPYFMKNFNEKFFTDKKSLVVNKYLQLKGYENIFVGGDITNVGEEKTGYNAERHGRLIAENIIRFKNNEKLKKYKIRKTPLIIGLGKYNGLIVYKNITLPGIIPAVFKKIVEKWTLFQLG